MQYRLGIIGFFMATVLLTGCNDSIVFKYPQPVGKKDLRAIPEKYHGLYFALDRSDTTWVGVYSDSVVQIKDQDNEIMFRLKPGKGVLRKMGRRYFLNKRTQGFWQVEYVEVDGANLNIYSIDIDIPYIESEDRYDSSQVEQLREVTPVQVIDGDLVMNPTRWELRKLIWKDQFKRDMQLVKYKELETHE